MSRKPISFISLKTIRLASVFALLMGITLGAYATLGDGKKKSSISSSALLSGRKALKPGTFSLRSGYSFRGNTVLSEAPSTTVIKINTEITVQKGKTSVTIPLRKNVVLGRVKIEIGNRQFQ